jgi:SpoVK/Ycf46/Vps4 family AAA+-type ATPase
MQGYISPIAIEPFTVSSLPSRTPFSQASLPQPKSIPDLQRARDDAIRELSELVGVQAIKDKVEEFCNTVIVDERRRSFGIEPVPMTNHMLFLGNAGTGKTTVAKVLARLLHGLGVVSKDTFRVYDNARTALIGGVVGETSKKAAKVFTDAVGGVLFLDEVRSAVGGVVTWYLGRYC